jgi:hypothetical protein
MRIVLLMVFLSVSVFSFAQKDAAFTGSEELGFINYLVRNGQYSEAVYHINELKENTFNTSNQRDSLLYLKGWAFYNQKMLDSSSVFLMKVSNNSSFYTKCRFFSAYNFTFNRNFQVAKEILNSVQPNDSVVEDLKTLQFAGISLLERNYNGYNNFTEHFKSNYYALSEEKSIVDDCAKTLKNFHPKSMFLSGAMSAIIPGSGKMYAGKVGEGVSALLMNAILASVTIENYRKAGPTNFKTIALGSLFTIFYIGNIYGSAISVKVYRDEFYKRYDNKILLHIHIPLRNIFND